MWPNKTPTHPCHSLQILRGSIKPLLHSNFERYSCPTLKYPTLFKNWKIEAIRNSFNFHMPSSISLNSCNMNQHLLLLLSSHFTLFPIAKRGGKVLSKTNSFFYSLMLLRKCQLHHHLWFVALATIPSPPTTTPVSHFSLGPSDFFYWPKNMPIRKQFSVMFPS